MTKRSTGTKVQARAKRKPAKASAARRQLMNLCERVEVLLLAMEKVAGGVLAWVLGRIADRLNAVVVAGCAPWFCGTVSIFSGTGGGERTVQRRAVRCRLCRVA